MRIEDITKDEDIYPRIRMSGETINSYAEALRAGAKFPPVLVQRITLDGEAKIISLDGWHTIEAHKALGRDEIEIEFWKDEPLDKSEWLEELRLVSLERNLAHGDRVTNRDLEYQLLKIVENRPVDRLVRLEKELAERLGLTTGRISQLIGAEVSRRKASRDALVYRLGLLGWIQDEIGEVVGIKSQGQVSTIIEKFNVKLFNNEHQSGLGAEEIANIHNLDEPLIWAILLEGKEDIERFALFGKSEYGNNQPKLSDYWKFAQRDPRLGIASYPGNLYGQEAMNIIYRYSRQGDLVVDPMAGGGITVDACLVMGRECRAYDVDPTKSGRNDVLLNDIREGYPERCQGCQLIIFDPPYYKKKEADYGDFSKDRSTFIDNIEKVAKDSYEVLKPGGYFALLYGQYLDYENEKDSILCGDLYRIFDDEKHFRCVMVIQSPLTFDIQWEFYDVDRAKTFEPWRILPVSKEWLVFQKL